PPHRTQGLLILRVVWAGSRGPHKGLDDLPTTNAGHAPPEVVGRRGLRRWGGVEQHPGEEADMTAGEARPHDSGEDTVLVALDRHERRQELAVVQAQVQGHAECALANGRAGYGPHDLAMAQSMAVSLFRPQQPGARLALQRQEVNGRAHAGVAG